jgi:hypothetical protein
MENNKTSFHKFMDATQGVKVEFALLDELVNTNMEAGSMMVIQKFIMDAVQKVEKSIAMNKEGLKKAEKGLEAAKELGDKNSIDTFTRWVASFKEDIKRAEGIIASLNKVDIGF